MQFEPTSKIDYDYCFTVTLYVLSNLLIEILHNM